MFIFEGLNLVLSFQALLVDLVLFRSDKGLLVNVGMTLNIRVVAQLKRVLESMSMGSKVKKELVLRRAGTTRTHLL